MTLIVNDLGLKYTNKRNVDKLLKIMSQWYVMKMDWGGTSFGGITLSILFIPFSSRWGDSSGDGCVGVVRVIFFGGYGCGESCGLFGWV